MIYPSVVLMGVVITMGHHHHRYDIEVVVLRKSYFENGEERQKPKNGFGTWIILGLFLDTKFLSKASWT